MKLRNGELQLAKNGKLFVKVLMSDVAFSLVMLIYLPYTHHFYFVRISMYAYIREVRYSDFNVYVLSKKTIVYP